MSRHSSTEPTPDAGRESQMRAYYFCGVTLIAVAAALGSMPASGGEEVAIRELEARQEAAWNAHDAHAYAQLFTVDADTVNVLGWWWKSRAELEQKLKVGFSFVFAHSQLHIDEVTARLLTPEVAIAHVRWSMTGAASPDGSNDHIPQKGIQTQTLYKTAEGWRIAAFQNANSVPERSFPRQGTP
jgi:uncharacterized protein (TIGR02246 family)